VNDLQHSNGWQHLEDALKLCFRLFCWAFYLCLCAFVFSGVHTVPQGKVAQIQRWGRWVEQIEQPGLHFAFPSFIDQVIIFDIQQRRKLECQAFQPPMANANNGSDRALLTSDGQLLHSHWTLIYRLENAAKTYSRFGSVEPADIDRLLESLLKATVIRTSASRNIDDLLTQQDSYRKAVNDTLKLHLHLLDSGLAIETLSLDALDVPSSTRDAFIAVQQAKLNKDQRRQQALNLARQKEQELLAQQSQTLGKALSSSEILRSSLKADAQNVKALVDQLDPKMQQTWLQLRRQEVMQLALKHNVDQSYWLQPGGELRLQMGKDPKIDQLRRVQADKKKP
jgi:regulator of protease activity HflC (stomatin/prohibitin superfamily)